MSSVKNTASSGDLNDPELEELLGELESDRASNNRPGAAKTVVIAAADTAASDPRNKTSHVASDANASANGEFPIPDLQRMQSPAELQAELENLARRLLAHNDYRKERANYIALNVQLDLVGRWAPAYRPEVKFSVAKKLGDAIYNIIHRDHLVIDYHWCHATGMDSDNPDPSHKLLLDPAGDFDFNEAWKLSGKKLRSIYRASEASILTTFQQCQTRLLRGQEVVARMESMSSGYRGSGGQFSSRYVVAMRQIAEWAERKPRMRPEVPCIGLCGWLASSWGQPTRK